MISITDLKTKKRSILNKDELKKVELKGMWLDFLDPSSSDIKNLAEKIGVDASVFQTVEIRTYSTVTFIKNLCVIYFSSLTKSYDSKKVSPFIFVLSPDFMVTIRKEDTMPMKLGKERIEKDTNIKPYSAVYHIMDEILSDYFNYLEQAENKGTAVEKEILNRTDDNALKDLFKLKSELIVFNKLLWYERGVIASLKKSSFIPKGGAKELFDGLHDDIARQIDIVETFIETLSDSMDAYLSIVSNKTNAIVKILTSITIILFVPTIIGTFYGMNVNLPFQQDANAFYFLISSSFLLAAGILAYFRHKKWI
ncbi:MAG TPA: CorA family divalent cation transporter [archaeon]|nr:CorA family divalent cation transporter [archaeon]